MEFQNKAPNVIKDDDAKEIELLTKDLKLTEDASAAIVPTQNDSGSTVSTQRDSFSTLSTQDESGPTVSTPDDRGAPMSAIDDSGSKVSTQDDSDSTVSTQDGSIATMTAKREFYLFMNDLQEIAEESKDSSFEKIHAGLLSESMIAHLKGKEIYELVVILLNRVERNIIMNEDSMRNFKELFGAMVSVLQYVISAGTFHLSLVNKKDVLMNLMVMRQEIRYRIKWLNRVQSDFESFLQFFNKIGIPAIFPHIKSAPVIAESLRTFIIAMKSFLAELEKYDGDASTIIECLKDELLTKVKFLH